MRRIVLIMMVLMSAIGMYAQKVNFQQSQTRIIEPLQDVYVRPLVVDLDIIKEERQVYGPFMDYIDKDISQITFDMLEEAKKNAAYNASIIDDADVIVAATFDIRTPEKGKGIMITVRGYPAKYTNWRKVNDNATDPKTGKPINDYEWLEKSLFEGLRIRKVTQGKNDEKTEAVGNSRGNR